MKKIIFQLCLAALATAFFPACMSSTRIQVLQPAAFKVPDHINVIAVIDRSKPSKGWVNVLEGMATGESINADKEGRHRAVQGLIEALTRTPRFTVKSTAVEMFGSRSGGVMLPPLDWRDVEDICRQYNVDAVAAIEFFDSDQNISRSRKEIKEKNKEGKETIRYTFVANRRLNVRLGWRLYDPKKQIIVDEAATTRGVNNEAQGDTENKATANLPSAYRIVEDLGFGSGLDYGARIAPTWITVTRQYYTSAKGVYADKMKQAARYAEGKEWTKAAEIWQPIAENKADKKAGGRAAMNMAVANEVLGKLEYALDWASKSYRDFGNNDARAYMDKLKMRMNDARKVDDQMK
jgi:hypothetical protein